MHKNIQQLPDYTKLIIDNTDKIEVSTLKYISDTAPNREYHDSHSITIGDIYNIFRNVIKEQIESCDYKLNECVDPEDL